MAAPTAPKPFVNRMHNITLITAPAVIVFASSFERFNAEYTPTKKPVKELKTTEIKRNGAFCHAS